MAAGQLEEFMLSGADPARDWSLPPETVEGQHRDIHQLLDEVGGTKALAQATGRSQRQVQRWQGTGIDNVTPASREALNRVNEELNRTARRHNAHAEWGELARRYGGTGGLATALGVHRTTVGRWMAGNTLPSEENLHRLHQADRRYRLTRTYPQLQIDPHTGKPTTSVHMKASGQVRARGTGGTPFYEYMRQLGVSSLSDLGHELPPDVAEDMFDHMHAGDTTGALDALQEHLSGGREDDPWSYAACGAYDIDNDIGFFIDDFTDFNLN